MAHKKGQGSTRNGRDSNAQRRGVKRFGGEAVTADEHIFTVSDLSGVWADVTVYAKDLGAVHEGQEATVMSADLGIEGKGRIQYVGPLIGDKTRSATARVVLPNPGRRWRPGRGRRCSWRRCPA